MSSVTRLALAGLRYHHGVHAMVVAGVAIAVAVLAGALIVGSSVRQSLRELALSRLGNTQIVVSSNTFFREALATEMAPGGSDTAPSAVIALTGALVHDGTGRTASRVQVFGINDAFMRFHGLAGDAPRERDAWISEGLAAELHAREGDGLILRVAKPTDIPLGTIQGRRDDAGERIRVSVARVADAASLGQFSLVPSQGPALTMFVALERLQRDLGLERRVNALLVAAGDATVASVRDRLRQAAALEDHGLRLRPSSNRQTLVVESRAGVMSTVLTNAVTTAAATLGANAEPVLVHLANVIRVRGREIPYSLVAGRPMEADAIALNQWAADDLDAKPGDRVELEYFVWSDAAGLEVKRTESIVGGIVAMEGDGGDATFTPEYPGLTDAVDVAGWDPPFPVDLTRVRRIDEDYWDRWRAAPKAFVPLQTAQQLWGTVQGNVSSLRLRVPLDSAFDAFTNRVTAALTQQLNQSGSELQIRDARGDALAAAEGTTDFGEYFVYFSFFLVVSGLLLAALFFALGVEQRAREIGILAAAGFAPRDIARLLVTEAGVLAIGGAVLGTIGAVAYAALIMHGLRTWWRDAVGTTALTLHVDWPLLLGGVVAALAAATLALALSLRTALRRTPRSLLSGSVDIATPKTRVSGPVPMIGLAAMAVAAAVAAAATVDAVPQTAGFFGAGSLLMIAGLAFFTWWLRRPAAGAAASRSHRTHRTSGVVRFGASYARWQPMRSVLSATLITVACFVLLSVGAFRRDPAGLSLDRAGGTGGFALMAESVAPLMHNPNTGRGRQELGLQADPLLNRARVIRFRLKPGDDASCLTLYQPRNPRIVAPEDAFLREQRFTFAQSIASTADERANPWLLLNRRFDDGAIPAIADQTSLTYVFHLKVGDDFVFSPDGGPETRLRIVGALADSGLQSELIIGEQAFVTLFPRREGYGVWMIDTQPEDATALATLLEDRLADFGVDVTDTRARLAAYHRVENTYLSTFQALGALGLLIGTLGLAAVLARNVLERQRELGLLRAVGFTPAHMRTLVLSESLLLVGVGLFVGSITALVAVLPALAARSSLPPWTGLAALLTMVTITAVISSILAARVATSGAVLTALRRE